MSEAVATHREEGVASLPLVAVALGALGLLCAGIYSFFVFHTGYVLLLLGISLVVLAVAAALMWRFALKRGGGSRFGVYRRAFSDGFVLLCGVSSGRCAR